jgi:hypothetical protein
MPRPTIRIFLMTTAGVLFAGGVAAAATGNNAFSPLLDVASDSSPTTTVVVETNETADALVVDPSDGLSPEELDVICAEASNHGEAVSAVAHDKTTVGAEHGAAVSAMAHRDCGKTDEETDDETETVEQDADAIEVDPSDGLSDEELAIICAEASNHGEAVSAVAHDKTKVGAEHGAAVSAMAQSNCGKDGDDDDVDSQQARGNSKKNKNGNQSGS